MKRRSYTLIEMLTVIAIISILAAMLLPAVNSARARGISAACINNLKNHAGAISNYLAAYDNYYPPYSIGGNKVCTDNLGNDGLFLMTRLYLPQEVKNWDGEGDTHTISKVQICPAARAQVVGGKNILGRDYLPSSTFSVLDAGSFGVRATDLKCPKILFMDGERGENYFEFKATSPSDTPDKASTAHMNFANALWTDGHATSHRTNSFPSEMASWKPYVNK